jgi:hypothetical protein
MRLTKRRWAPAAGWPPLAESVTDAVGRLLDGARIEQQT